MSEVSSVPIWVGPIFGGVILSLMSVGGTYYVERKIPATKIIARDFILGAILVLCIMQFLPESVTKAIAGIISVSSLIANKTASTMASVSTVPDVTGVTNMLEATSVKALSFIPESSEEVRVGVPRF